MRKKPLPPARGQRTISVPAIIRRMLTMLTITLSLVIVLLLVLLFSFTRQYASILHNATTAAEFHSAFKDTIDQAMYSHVIQPRSDASLASLPLSELNDAVGVLNRLEETTTLSDNRWRIDSMLMMCQNLRNYMIEIAECDRYDDRMELLERNIRGETGLTLLIQDYMHAYVDAEVREMARLQRTLSQQLPVIIAGIILLVVLILILTLTYSVKLSRRITSPISSLVEKTRLFGDGKLDQQPVATDLSELQMLDRGFDDMSSRINTLMEKQRQDQQYLHRAELELLQAQINPHFLYNTLDSIAILAEMERNEDVITMVTRLSTLFRTSLSKGKDIIPLSEELTHVTSYLEIQHIRYSDIMQYNILVPNEFYDCLVPKLILQPLVENALYHGIKNKRAMGLISITGEHDGDDMLIHIQDNGAGMTDEQLEALRQGIYEDKHTGLGLLNVYKRIQLYCGKEYGLLFDSTAGKGTVVTLRLPTHLNLPESLKGEMP